MRAYFSLGSPASPSTPRCERRAEVGAGLTGGVSPNRAVIGENLLALEASNPTATPASSPLLNGRWKFLYASGASPSLGALRTLMRGAARAPKSPSGAELVDVEDAYLTINSVQPRATSSVKVRVLSLESELKLTSTLEPESAVRLVETYDGFESGTGNLRLPLGSTPRKPVGGRFLLSRSARSTSMTAAAFSPSRSARARLYGSTHVSGTRARCWFRTSTRSYWSCATRRADQTSCRDAPRSSGRPHRSRATRPMRVRPARRERSTPRARRARRRRTRESKVK